MEGGMLEYQTFSTYGCGLIQDEQTRGVPPLAAAQAQALVPPALRKMPGLMPRLLDLSALDAAGKTQVLASLNQAAHDGEDLWLALLLQSERPADAVAAHCRSRMIVDIAGQGAVFFPVFDPRVLVQLSWLLDPATGLAVRPGAALSVSPGWRVARAGPARRGPGAAPSADGGAVVRVDPDAALE